MSLPTFSEMDFLYSGWILHRFPVFEKSLLIWMNKNQGLMLLGKFVLFWQRLQSEFDIPAHFKRGLSLLCQDFLPPLNYPVLAGNKILGFLILYGAWRCLKKH